MIISLNGKDFHLTGQMSLLEFLDQEQLNQKGIAVAIDDEVIPKSKWSETTLKDQNNLLIITATQGG